MSGGVRGRKFLNQRNLLLLDFLVLHRNMCDNNCIDRKEAV